MSTNGQQLDDYHKEIKKEQRNLEQLHGDELAWRRDLVTKALNELVVLDEKPTSARAQQSLDSILQRLKNPTDRDRIR